MAGLGEWDGFYGRACDHCFITPMARSQSSIVVAPVCAFMLAGRAAESSSSDDSAAIKDEVVVALGKRDF